MKAIILAAGEGSRMRPLTYTRPKVMLPIANKPILEHLILETREAGITDFILVVGYHDEQVRSYFSNGHRWSVNISYSNQRRQLGTADAVRMVEGMIDGNFLMMNGDIIVDRKDISALASAIQTTISVIKVKDHTGLGMIELQQDRVVKIHEKVENPPTDLANTGLYFFTPDIFSAIKKTPTSPRGEYEITSSLQIMIDEGREVSCHKIGHWLDLSYPWHILSANETLLSGLTSENNGNVENNVTLNGKVSIGARSNVRSGAYIEGPVLIGEDCEIGPNCYIRPFTSIGDHCHVGAAVEIKNSVIMNGAKVPHLNYVGDSIIGEGCNLGAGTKIANLRFDEKEVTIGEYNTGRRKFGAVLGDSVKTGINVSINTGTLIGNNTFIGPGAIVGGIINPESKVF